jgi:hypothetical protein
MPSVTKAPIVPLPLEIPIPESSEGEDVIIGVPTPRAVTIHYDVLVDEALRALLDNHSWVVSSFDVDFHPGMYYTLYAVDEPSVEIHLMGKDFSLTS